MSGLGRRTMTGVTDTTNPVRAGGWTVTFSAKDLPRVRAEVYHIAVKGPAPSTFQIFVGTTFYSAVPRGDLNDWDPSQPMLVDPGDDIFFYYDTAATPRPTVAIFLREASPF